MTDDIPRSPAEPDDDAWIRQAYAATPSARPDAVAETVAAARAVVSHAVRPMWTRMKLAGAFALAAACLIGIGWQYRRTATQQRATPTDTSTTSHVTPSVAQTAPFNALPVSSSHTDDSMSPKPHFMPRTVTPLPSTSILTRAMDSSRDNHALVAPRAPNVNTLTLPSRTYATMVAELDPESAAAILTILDSAATRGLPVTAIASRAREGIRRGVPGARVVVVTRNFTAALNDTRVALGASVTSAELQSGAEAILAGAPVSALRQIRNARPGVSVAEPLVALADLASHGVPPLQASAALAMLMARNASDADVRILRRQIVGDIINGVAPDAALMNRVHSEPNQPLQRPGDSTTSLKQRP